MITLISKAGDQKLRVLDYDETRTNVRYKAVINDAQLSVLHLQSVDIEDTQPDLSKLSLCPGAIEADFSGSAAIEKLLIEKAGDEIVLRLIRGDRDSVALTD